MRTAPSLALDGTPCSMSVGFVDEELSLRAVDRSTSFGGVDHRGSCFRANDHLNWVNWNGNNYFLKSFRPR